MGNLFTKDSEINISKSPFSAFTNEKMIFDGRLDFIPMEHIMMAVKRGNVYGADFVILEALSEMEFATSRIVTQYLSLRNINMPQEKVCKRLRFMTKKKIISRFKFQSDEGNPNLRVYCLEKAGKMLLISRNYQCKWKQTDNTRPIDVVKEILSRNQLLLNYKVNLSDKIDKYVLNPTFRLRTSNTTFKPHLQINIKSEEDTEIIFYEVIRSYEGYKEKTLERLQMYKEYYEYFTPSKDIPKPPKLILVGELDKHLAEIFKLILVNKVQLQNMNYLYTTDLRIIGEELNKSVFTFNIVKENEKNLIKIRELNLPFLK